MAAITDADRALMAAVRADARAYEMLQHKCRWEGMTLYGVLLEWGDPRTWPSWSWERRGREMVIRLKHMREEPIRQDCEENGA